MIRPISVNCNTPQTKPQKGQSQSIIREEHSVNTQPDKDKTAETLRGLGGRA